MPSSYDDRPINPYATTSEDIPWADTAAFSEPMEFAVDGDAVVVSANAELPMFCVKTNEPVDELQGKWVTMYWSPPLLALSFLVCGLLGVVLYFGFRQRCYIRVYYSQGLRRRYALSFAIRLLIVTAIIGGSIALCTLAFAPVELAILSMASLLLLLFGNSPIRIKKFESGKFWIAGCSKEYLQRLSDMNFRGQFKRG